MHASAQILSHVSKMDQRLKRTEELCQLMEKELFGSVLPFNTDDEICSFLRDPKQSLRLGVSLASRVNWSLHWGKDIVQILFAPEYIREHYWPPDV